MKPQVFVTRELPGDALERLSTDCTVEIWPDSEVPPPHDVLMEKAKDISGLISLLTDTIDAPFFEAAAQLKVVSNYAVGYDNIDISAATARNIPVGHTPGVLTETTADFAFALLMAAARRITEGVEFARAGKWRSWCPTLLLGVDIHGATLGIVGMGRIGRAMVRRANGFGMNVVFFDPTHDATETIDGAQRASLEEVVAQSDFLSLHVPLTPQTRHLVSRELLGQMKPSAVLINTSRGQVIDQTALYEALNSGQISSAALDVTDPEPLPAEHPLFTLDNCLIVPHLGSASIATRSKMATIATENLLAGLRGERLPHCVNPEIYKK